MIKYNVYITTYKKETKVYFTNRYTNITIEKEKFYSIFEDMKKNLIIDDIIKYDEAQKKYKEYETMYCYELYENNGTQLIKHIESEIPFNIGQVFEIDDKKCFVDGIYFDGIKERWCVILNSYDRRVTEEYIDEQLKSDYEDYVMFRRDYKDFIIKIAPTKTNIPKKWYEFWK